MSSVSDIITVENLEPLVSAMHELGEDLLKWRHDPDATFVHSKEGLKLEADRRAHRLLTQVISSTWPGIPIISEEDISHDSKRPSEYWLIDPIDGTASWLNGFEGFVTQAAFLQNEQAIASVIHAPALKRTYLALRDSGAWLNGKRLPILEDRSSLIITDNTPSPHSIAAVLMQELPGTEYWESGSLGLKTCLVADGTADLCVKTVMVRDWDLAPSSVLFKEVGAVLLGIDGQPYTFNGAWEKPDGFVAARNHCLATRSLEIVSRNIASGVMK